MNTETTAPTPLAESQPIQKRRWPWVLLGILLILLGGGLGGGLGYQSAIQQRMNEQNKLVIMEATTQFELGMLDMQAGRLEVARQRFERVIELDPSYPGVQEKLAEVLLKISSISSPTPVPTPTPHYTATPDLRPVEDLYLQTQQQLRNQAWREAMQTADTLRSTNVNFRTAQVDGVYYIALRNLGVQKILNDGDLEGGIYDLTLAERFGPLDRDADNYRTWARYYLTGASFWKADWKRVVDYFGEIYFAFPSLRDSSGMTATERYRLANIYYGDQLVSQGEYCDARLYYETGLNLSPDPVIQSTLDAVYTLCDNPNGEEDEPDPTATPTPPIVETPTPPVVETPTTEPATEEPSPTP